MAKQFLQSDTSSVHETSDRKQYRHSSRFNSHQRGVVLIIALVVLVGMTLAAIALVRSVDTGNIVAGNLAFKRSATVGADAGVEAAIAYLVPKASSADLYNNQAAFGYYATSQDTLDRTGNSADSTKARVDWDNDGCSGATVCIAPSDAVEDDAGNSVRYIIHRLCQSAGDPNDIANSCVTYSPASSVSNKRGELKYGDNVRFAGSPTPYYRVTARAKGPRNTVSYVETMIHF